MTTLENDMNPFYILLAILAGIFTTIESSINSQLGKYITPGIATLHSLMVGMTFILFLNLINGKLIYYTKITTIKPLWLIGGIFGASIIYLSSSAIPQLGISNTIILVLSGQLLSGLIVDAIANNVELSARKAAGLILFLIGAIIYLKE
jgi:transporter family-2 protein